MKAVLQYGPGAEPVIEDIPIPQPGRGEVLVRMSASPVNPSDLSMLQGTYAVKPTYPVIPGIEGSGVVVKAGPGLLPGLRLGKRVSCTATAGLGGTWAEYIVTSAMNCVPLPGTISMEQGSMLLVNPMTAISFVNIARQGGHRAIVNNAATSALGKMLRRICSAKGIILVNIVRGKENYDRLKAEGVEYLLDSEDDSFSGNLNEISKRLGASLFLDAVGGRQTSIIVEAAPKGSTILLYAKLSEENINIDSRVIVQGDKTISGFYLGNWTRKRNLLKLLSDISMVKKLIPGDLRSDVMGRYKIDEVNRAIENYRRNMSGGKVLITFEDPRKTEQ